MGFKNNNPGCGCCPDISGGCDLCSEGTPDPLPITLDGWDAGTSPLYSCGSCLSLNATYNLVFEAATTTTCKWIWGGMTACGTMAITAFLRVYGANAYWDVSLVLGNPVGNRTVATFQGVAAPYPIECGGVESLTLMSWYSVPPYYGGTLFCHPEFLTCQVN